MADREYPKCRGTGYTLDASGEEDLCPMCDGTRILTMVEADVDIV